MRKVKRGNGLLVGLRSDFQWCDACKGSGDAPYNGHFYPTCHRCDGKGYHSKETITIEISAEMRSVLRAIVGVR